MIKKFVLAIGIILFSFSFSHAKGEYDDQLNQLASEISSYVVGTPDATFESCAYQDGMLCFVVNPESEIGKAKISDYFNEELYPVVLEQMFRGDQRQAISIMDFLSATGTVFCFKIKMPGAESYSESTIHPSTIKERIQQKINQ